MTRRHRPIVARLVPDEGWPIGEVAARYRLPGPRDERGLFDNGGAFRSHLWRDTGLELEGWLH